ncbi:MAG: acetyl-CoA carboxylase carboxyltransferase subunit beta [Phycisphaeraceae bacterium]|nr:acetyl-CoA carboxylase carboxyltransferase subunit beta [Phycisphaeraceae bacterium]MCB9847364.1 acetyl-CoA carboxylase carboxyltransferase subunit beta [Phycisphaeraceae bacterium]
MAEETTTPAAPAAQAPLKTLSRTLPGPTGAGKRSNVPEGLWLRCTGCAKMIFRKQLENNLHVCPECGHHYRIGAQERIRQLVDPETFEPMFEDLRCTDPLNFVDLKKYPDRITAEVERSGRPDAIIAGRAFIKGRPAVLACLDLSFMMGSMGSVVGETLTRSIEYATDNDLPLIIVSCSGGARMQESGLSLMQMAKTSAALAQFDDAGGLFISVLTDPTTGGVTASFAMLGDVNFAEPGALVGFAGPRVIKQTIRQDLPEGFQRSEYLQDKGMVDRVIPRHELRNEIARVIDYAGK